MPPAAGDIFFRKGGGRLDELAADANAITVVDQD
jgi:hypothetical protein